MALTGRCHSSQIQGTCLSAAHYPEVVTAYIDNECSLGWLLGLFGRCGVIPKGHKTGKWRLIVDLLLPPGKSVNDSNDSNLCSLVYKSIDQVTTVAASYQPGALMAKVDIESAYCLIRVHSKTTHS